jgi:DNA-binding GntR family transcriptional regulator
MLTDTREISVVRPATAAERAYFAIQRMIITGRFKSGDWFTKGLLSRELKMSATPVGQALQRLEQEGLIQILPAWGARVRSYCADEYQEAFEQRALLEGLVVRWCVRHATDAAIEALRPLAELLDEGNRNQIRAGKVSRPVKEQIITDNWKFHGQLAEASGMRLVPRDVSRLHLLAMTCRVGIPHADNPRLVPHVDLINAILNRDEQQGDALMRQHVLAVADQMVPYLRQRFGNGPVMLDEAEDVEENGR